MGRSTSDAQIPAAVHAIARVRPSTLRLPRPSSSRAAARLSTKVPCTTKGAYEVVGKVSFQADKTACDGPLGPGKGKWDATYTHDESPGTLGDYTLCLKKRA